MIEKEQCFKHRNKIYDDIVSFVYEDPEIRELKIPITARH